METRVARVKAVTILQNILMRRVILSNSAQGKISPAILRGFFYFFIFYAHSEYAYIHDIVLEIEREREKGG